MTPNMVMALIGALVATCATIASALVFVITSSKAAGRREGKLDEALDKLKLINTSLEKIPVLEMRIAQHSTLFETMRSDIRELKKPRGSAESIHIPRARLPSNPGDV